MWNLIKILVGLLGAVASGLGIYTFATGNTTLAEAVGLGEIAKVVVQGASDAESKPIVQSDISQYRHLMEVAPGPNGERLIYAERKAVFLQYHLVALRCSVDLSCERQALMPIPLLMGRIDTLLSVNAGQDLVGINRNGRGFVYNVAARRFTVFKIKIPCRGAGFYRPEAGSGGVFSIRSTYTSGGRVYYRLNAIDCQGDIRIGDQSFPLPAGGGRLQLDMGFSPDPLGFIRDGELTVTRWQKGGSPGWFSPASGSGQFTPFSVARPTPPPRIVAILKAHENERLEVGDNIPEHRMLAAMRLTGLAREEILAVFDQSESRKGDVGIYFSADALSVKAGVVATRTIGYKSLQGVKPTKFAQALFYGSFLVPSHQGDDARVKSVIADLVAESELHQLRTTAALQDLASAPSAP